MSAFRDGKPLIYATTVNNSAGALSIDGRSFVSRYIEQFTSKPATQNTITVTLRSNYVVPVFASISILGLVNASPAGPRQTSQLIQLIKVGDKPDGGLNFGDAQTGKLGTWLKAEEGLVLNVRQALISNEDVVFSFEIVNPTSGQVSPQVTLRTTTLLIGPLPITTEGPDNTFTVVERAFIRSNIRQSTCFPGATNTITAEFSINFDITNVDYQLSKLILSISGLISPSSSDPASIQMPAGFVDTSWTGFEKQFQRTGEWREKEGLMLIRTAPSATGIYSGFKYNVSWEIKNPFTAQDPAPTSAVYMRLSYTDGDRSWLITERMKMSNLTLPFKGSVAGDAYPLKVGGIRAFVSSMYALDDLGGRRHRSKGLEV